MAAKQSKQEDSAPMEFATVFSRADFDPFAESPAIAVPNFTTQDVASPEVLVAPESDPKSGKSASPKEN